MVSPFEIAWNTAFLILLVIACATDLRERRVPNELVLVLLGAGLLRTLLVGSVSGLGVAIAQAGLGLALWLPLYVFRMLGAGDVKLFAAGSAWLTGFTPVLHAALAAALLGGMLSLLWLAVHREAVGALNRLAITVRHRVGGLAAPDAPRGRRLPYAIAISGGLAWTLMFRSWS